jgi:hypothetical protein
MSKQFPKNLQTLDFESNLNLNEEESPCYLKRGVQGQSQASKRHNSINFPIGGPNNSMYEFDLFEDSRRCYDNIQIADDRIEVKKFPRIINYHFLEH